MIGQPIALDGHPFTIIGVSQRDFRGVQIGRAFDVAAPLGTEPIVRGIESSLDRRSNWWLTVVGRLAPGQTLEQAQARLRALPAAAARGDDAAGLARRTISSEYLNEPIVADAGRHRHLEPARSLFAGRSTCCSASSAWC